jgi:class III lanthionine synthetase
MDMRYEAFCLADPQFYETPASWEADSDSFEVSPGSYPSGWERSQRGVWSVLRPVAYSGPEQGWKVHVSAVVKNAASVLTTVAEYCLPRGIPFKFITNERALVARNSKYAPRESSGKFITIYPMDDRELERILVDLSLALVRERGPYILSDLRYEEGPLYVRYGAFVEMWTPDESGRLVPALRRPDGTLVPDRREPVFRTPDWVPIPSVLRPQLELRTGPVTPDYPYHVERALHFSNGGGVYLARPAGSDDLVVLKEARPLAAMEWDGTDAVRRLYHEGRVLKRLAGIPGVPELHDLVAMWEHDFLVMQHMPGRPLTQWLADEYPCTRGDVLPEDLRGYTRRALELLAKIEKLMRDIHDRGVVFADLHPGNILVDDGSVSLVDFELAFPVGEPRRRPTFGAPGFGAPADLTGFAVDEYALAVLRLWLFLPMTTVAALDPAKLRAHVDFIRRRFALPVGYVEEILAEIAPDRAELVPRGPISDARGLVAADCAEDGDEHGGGLLPEYCWDALRGSVIDAIRASATPERRDRLFPGDIEQFALGGTCYAYGAAGVLHALAVSGGGRHPQHEQWLLAAVRREPLRRPGFYDGAHGVAYVLDFFGHREEAAALVRAAAPLVEAGKDHGLCGGLAGVGLNLLHLGQTWKDSALVADALSVADRLVERLAVAGPSRPNSAVGLLRGWTGPALLFLRLYEHTFDRSWLRVAERALSRDLGRSDGSSPVPSGPRDTSTLAAGSAGIALVADLLVNHLPDAVCATDLPVLARACQAEFVPEAGLFSGRAGLLGAVATFLRSGVDPEAEQALHRHLTMLISLHATNYLGALAFPGKHSLRLSMDFATGSAGVLRAMALALGGKGTLLPFL